MQNFGIDGSDEGRWRAFVEESSTEVPRPSTMRNVRSSTVGPIFKKKKKKKIPTVTPQTAFVMRKSLVFVVS